VFPTFEKLSRSIRKSKKSQPLASIFKQTICLLCYRSGRPLIQWFLSFLADGTSSHISYFDDLKDDDGYAAGIEASPEEMLSSH